jgi:hypothetical protein
MSGGRGISERSNLVRTLIDLIAESFLFKPVLAAMFVKDLIPEPPDQDQVVAQETVVPLKEVRRAHCDPVAPLIPHWSR